MQVNLQEKKPKVKYCVISLQNIFSLLYNCDFKKFLFYLEEKRKEAIAAASDLTQALVDHLNVGYV